MRRWRDAVLDQLVPAAFRLTVVADPDGLLLDEHILHRLREARLDLLPFEDHVAFRLAYEKGYRSRWDSGEALECHLLVRTDSPDLERLPYDLLQTGHNLCLSLSDLFPRLSYRVVEAVDRNDLDALYAAQSGPGGKTLGENETKDFVLKHVFKIAPDMVTEPRDLLEMLLDRHHRNHRIPPLLESRLVQLLRQSGRFADWPLEGIVPDRDAFFRFLQERWPYYLDRKASELTGSHLESSTPYGLEFGGPLALPFAEVRSDIDTLFLDGVLRPVEHKHADILVGEWVAVGLHTDPETDRVRRLEHLLQVLEALPVPDAPSKEWLLWARRWADVRVLRSTLSGEHADLTGNLIALQTNSDAAFLAWLLKRYAGLYNQPQSMVHHIPRMLQRHRETTGRRIALIVVDGLALAQWTILRDSLHKQHPELTYEEQMLFAWIPTITPVSRQAIFSGRLPQEFAGSIGTTGKEGNLWRQAWADSVGPAAVMYGKVRGDEPMLETIEALIGPAKVQVAGLVINKIDDIMHGAELGMTGMDGQVRLWAEQGFLAQLLGLLWQRGYDVFLTSDHGNVEAVGHGRPTNEGSVADVRGQRARIYPTDLLRGQVAGQFPDAVLWPSGHGLPPDYWPLLAGERSAFTSAGQRTVGHGGACIEEVVVPFITLSRPPA